MKYLTVRQYGNLGAMCAHAQITPLILLLLMCYHIINLILHIKTSLQINKIHMNVKMDSYNL